ncbi:nucleoside hydrolase [Amycolatopsis viridis]|uniref:Purine nucleosidase n=1 Tax=Amycolatopsis viridis TaxID=185678 RepID=A0ABX0T0M2_9PSEU|nr:nucleoside hydrolase [Amycolatopsis viridis]NIH82788.1 purine nucleosidase [Amycolatopsis viridis]
MTPQAAPVPVLVDTDGGLDDALALVFLTRSPAVDVVAIGSVHGNVPAEAAARNTLRVLELLETEVPVAQGATAPLTREVHYRHPEDPVGRLLGPPAAKPVGEPAAAQLLRHVRARPGELALLMLGPLTNLALALQREPRLPGLAGRVVVMGGVFTGDGSVSAVAETNIWSDPEAADQVLTAGFDLTLVGLDVTRQVQPTTGWLTALAQDPLPWGGFAKLLAAAPTDQRPPMPLHDPLAAAVLARPDLVSCRTTPVRVELAEGAARGRTRADSSGRGGQPAVQVAEDVHVEQALDVLIEGLVPGLR